MMLKMKLESKFLLFFNFKTPNNPKIKIINKKQPFKDCFFYVKLNFEFQDIPRIKIYNLKSEIKNFTL